MGPTHGPYILQLYMGPSYFWRGLTPPDQRPGCGYKQEQMANSCCPLSYQGPEDLNAQLYTAALSVTQTTPPPHFAHW